MKQFICSVLDQKCAFIAQGMTEEDVLEKVLDHIEKEHVYLIESEDDNIEEVVIDAIVDV